MQRMACRKHLLTSYARFLGTQSGTSRFQPGSFLETRPDFLRVGFIANLYHWYKVQSILWCFRTNRDEMQKGAKFSTEKISEALAFGDFDSLRDAMDSDVVSYISALGKKTKAMKLVLDEARVRSGGLKARHTKYRIDYLARVEVEMILQVVLAGSSTPCWKHEMWVFEAHFASTEARDGKRLELGTRRKTTMNPPSWRLINIYLY